MSCRALVLLAVGLLAAACTTGGTAARPPTSAPATTTPPPSTIPLPVVRTTATPAGWVPVDFGDAQVSVPADWNVAYDAGCVAPAAPGVLYVGRSGYDHCPEAAPSTAPVVLLAPLPVQSSAPAAGPPKRVVNGIAVFGRMAADGYGNYEVPALGVRITIHGRHGLGVLATLTRSPATVALARGPAPRVPQSWQWVTGGDVRFAVPGTWTTASSDIVSVGCGFRPNIYPVDSVLVDGDRSVAAPACASIQALRPPSPPTDGVIVNLRPSGAPVPPAVPILRSACLHLHGVTACPYDHATTAADDSMAELDILFVQVTVPGHAGHELLEIGLAGNGTVARTILYSLRPA